MTDTVRIRGNEALKEVCGQEKEKDFIVLLNAGVIDHDAD